MSVAASALAHSATALTSIGGRVAALMAATELRLRCSDDLLIAGQSWKSNSSKSCAKAPSKRVLALHGWMDNSASFHILAPRLVEELDNTEVVALDFIGHGRSSHKSKDGGQSLLAEGAYYVAEAVQELQWNNTASNDGIVPFTLIGHSMGAALACLYAAAFPEQVERLILLDGLGPVARNPRETAQHVRAHVAQRQLGNRSKKAPRIYDSIEQAVQTRQQTALRFPGHKYLSQVAAHAMVDRGTRKLDNGHVQFLHDARLAWPSLQYFTPDQTAALYADIQCPTCLITAVDGWPFDVEKAQQAMELLQPQHYCELPGSHHLHADPDSAEAVVQEVVKFLQSC